MADTGHPAWRISLESALSLERVIPWLGADSRPFVLAGEWLGLAAADRGGVIIGSEPALVAGSEQDPFELLSRQPRVANEPIAKVGGGWVGWLGYGLGARIESLPAQPPAPVARSEFALAFYDHVLLLDGGQWWFEALVSDEREAALRERLDVWRGRLGARGAAGGAAGVSVANSPHRTKRDTHEAAALTASQRPDAKPAATLAPFVTVGSGGAGHLVAVADCRERIAAGDLFQANLCLRLEAGIDGDLAGLFANAVDRARPRFGALMDGVLSLSPERFLRREGRIVTAEPIKGTRPRGGDAGAQKRAREELEASAKDAAEHVMIVDLMRNDLGRVSVYGSVTAQPPRVEAHANVWHLVSTVRGQLRDGIDDGQLLRATFPPGSVTGAPKVQAMKVISELEVTARGLYTGAIGIASPVAGLDLSVAIRTFESDGERIWLGVGGGVVADSQPEPELDEALTKAIGPLAAVGARLAQPPEALVAAAAQRLATLAASPVYASAEAALRFGARPDPADGVFETLLVESDKAVLALEHIDRLVTSMRAVYERDLDATELKAMVDDTARGCRGVRSRLRVEADPDGGVRIVTQPAGRPPDTAHLVPFILPGGIGVHKWRDRRLIEALIARISGRVALLVDLDGTVLEAAQANVWIVEGEMLLTPPTDGRILPGVTRAQLLASDPNAREQSFDLDRLAAADAIFLTGSVAGRRAAELDLHPCDQREP